jgi:uncharacterized protein
LVIKVLQEGMSMADYRLQTQTAGTRSEIDAGLRSHMLGVYNYMALGIAAAAILVFASFTIPAFGAVVRMLYFPAIIGLLALGWFGYKMILQSRSVATAHIAYWAYVACWGIGIAPLVNRYLGINPSIVMTAFLSAAVTFGAMSVWGYSSKKDLSGMGRIAGMALLGLFLAAIVNLVVAMFTGVTGAALMISYLISAGFVIFVSILTAWETQAIKEMYAESDSSDDATRKSVFGAFMLFGSFVSIFQNLLYLFGALSDE